MGVHKYGGTVEKIIEQVFSLLPYKGGMGGLKGF